MKFRITRDSMNSLQDFLTKSNNDFLEIELEPMPSTVANALAMKGEHDSGYFKGYEKGYKDGYYEGSKLENRQYILTNGINFCGCGFVGPLNQKHVCQQSWTIDSFKFKD